MIVIVVLQTVRLELSVVLCGRKVKVAVVSIVSGGEVRICERERDVYRTNRRRTACDENTKVPKL